MKLDTLVHVEYFRDGGSYEARFLSGGRSFVLSLRIAGIDSSGGRRYGGLYPCALGLPRCAPIARESPQEAEVLAALDEWVRNNVAEDLRAGTSRELSAEERRQRMLLEMLREIAGREF